MIDTIIKPEIKQNFPLRVAVIFLLFSAAIIMAGIYYYKLERKLIFEEAENSLSSIALLKIEQIDHWRKERISDATVFSQDKSLIRNLKLFLSGNNDEARTELAEWMQLVRKHYDYLNVLIADTSYNVRLSVNSTDFILGDSIKGEMRSALKDRKVVLTDLHRSKEIPSIHLDILVPFIDSVNTKKSAVGFAIFRIDPDKMLFPLVQEWPTSSKSAETLLLRKENDSIIFLNNLRHSKSTALRLKLSLKNRTLLAAKAVSGFEGLTEGTDYRNIPVVGSIHKVPGVAWYMVSKVDKAEILHSLKKYGSLLIIIIVLLVLINASIFVFWIWQQRMKFYRSQLKNEISIRELEERFSTAFRMSPVSLTISSVSDNKFIDVNNTFLRDMEYNRDEVIGRTAKELDIWIDENERQWIINEIHENGNVFGKVIKYKTRTGKLIYGLSSMSVVNVNGESCNLSTVVNITESKEADLRLFESEELFRKLFENMLNGFAYCKMIHENGCPLDFLYISVNESFTTHTGLKDVMGKRASVAIPGIQESDPELLERYDRVASTGIPEVFEIYVESLKMWFAISLYCPQKGYFVAVFDVITAKKLSEEKLVESEERFRSLYNNVTIGIYRTTAEGQILLANPALLSMLGFNTFEQLANRNLQSEGYEPDYPRSKFLDTIEKEGKIIGLESAWKRSNGDVLYVRESAIAVRDEKGKMLYYDGTVEDITEHKKVEEALRESEDKFKYNFDHSVAGKSITFPSGEIHVNRAFCEMTGYSPEELATTKWQDISHPDDIKETEDKLQLLISGEKKSVRFIKRYIHKNGSIVWADVGTAVRCDENGKPLYFMTTAIDITERKLAEEALSESEERFSKSFRTSPISFMIADIEDGRIIEVNDAFTIISGYTHEEALSSTTLDLNIWVHEQDRKNMIDSLHKGKAILHMETMLRAKDGRVAIVLLSAQVIKLANRNCIISSIEDITERKRAEEALRESEERFRSMTNSIPQLAWVARADGFIYWYNKRWYEYTGTKQEQMEGWGWQIVHDPEMLPVVLENWTASIASGKLFEMTFPLRGADGLFRTFLTRVYPLKDSEGRVVQWFGTNTDVETLKQAEKTINKLNEELEMKVIQRTELLEAANKELEAFSYSVSHDLRAPLRSVHGFTKILLEDYESKLDDEGKRICEIISASATQMGELIDDLLSFSRIGRSTLNPSDIDMKKMARVIFEGMTSPAERERIMLNIGKMPVAFGDVALFGQVWTNLISNAIKYTSKNDASEINIGSKADGKMNVYYIKDNGVGFEMQYAHKLFGVFQRLHSESDFEGNGVGLAIVQRIIHKHGGKVWADGEPGKGATFYFSLPVEDKRQKLKVRS